MSDETYYLTIIIAIILGVAGITSFCVHESEQTDREAIKAGLIQKDGRYGKQVWTKPDQNP